MTLIQTDPKKCLGRYACVRKCPVKAIRVIEDLPEVSYERYVACGTCV